MILEKNNCVNHPDRTATAICMITKKPICAECSTQYEGVNYSKEGLELLKQQRTAKLAFGGKDRMIEILALIISPLLLYFLYFFYNGLFQMIIDMRLS